VYPVIFSTCTLVYRIIYIYRTLLWMFTVYARFLVVKYFEVILTITTRYLQLLFNWKLYNLTTYNNIYIYICIIRPSSLYNTIYVIYFSVNYYLFIITLSTNSTQVYPYTIYIYVSCNREIFALYYTYIEPPYLTGLKNVYQSNTSVFPRGSFLISLNGHFSF